MTDQIDLADMVPHASYDIRNFAPTITLRAVEFRSGDTLGVRPIFEPSPAPWPSQNPPGWNGPIQFTLWAFVRVNGRWHGGAMLEFWQGREWSGANWLEPGKNGSNNWQENWAYRPEIYGEMSHYVPRPGDQVGFMLTAGDCRPPVAMHTVAERTNTIIVTLARDGMALPIGQQAPESTSQPPLQPQSQVPAASSELISAITAALAPAFAEQMRLLTEIRDQERLILAAFQELTQTPR